MRPMSNGDSWSPEPVITVVTIVAGRKRSAFTTPLTLVDNNRSYNVSIGCGRSPPGTIGRRFEIVFEEEVDERNGTTTVYYPRIDEGAKRRITFVQRLTREY
jgi:hypothetical protein